MTHEINTPIGAIRSMNNTKAKAAKKLQTALANIVPDTVEIKKVMDVILKADQLIDQGTERLHEIMNNLKTVISKGTDNYIYTVIANIIAEYYLDQFFDYSLITEMENVNINLLTIDIKTALLTTKIALACNTMYLPGIYFDYSS